MSKRITCDRFICEGCQQEIVKAPKFDNRTRYCSPRCKIGVWFRNHPPKPKQLQLQLLRRVDVACAFCGKTFQKTPSDNRQSCGPVCASGLRGMAMTGKKLRPYVRKIHTYQCLDCGVDVQALRPARCHHCRRTACGSKNHCQRAKRKGAPRDYSITNTKVFQRDGWTCQLCGCPTPKELKGSHLPNAPEMDHIIPIALGGGHTWGNVQCTCRQCNQAKGCYINEMGGGISISTARGAQTAPEL